MNILFITRKFPPMKGGMEKVAFELYNNLSKKSNVKLLSYSGSNIFLPIVLPYFLFRALWDLSTKKIDVIYLQDGLLSPLGVLFKLAEKPVAVTIHGLDIRYKNPLYQYVIPKCVKKLDKIICVSNRTKEECTRRGVSPDRITVIHNGISDEYFIKEKNKQLRKVLNKKIKSPIYSKKVLLSVGRLIERKGVHWFVEKIVPILVKMDKEVVYVIVGEGPFEKKINELILKLNLEGNIVMLGEVDEETLKLLYNSSDIFIMPNVPVPGDMEGFGMVALEAASCELPVISSNIDGIKDAIKNNENGFLIETYDVDGYISVLKKLFENDSKKRRFGKKARNFTLENYNWKKITENYLMEFNKLQR